MIAHFRPIFVCFIALALGLWLGKIWLYDSIWYFVLVVSILVFCLFMLLFKIKFKQSKFVDFFWNIRKWVICILIPVLVGFGLFYLVYVSFKIDFKPKTGETYNISGTIDTNYIIKEKGVYFIISNVSVTHDRTGTAYLDRNVFVYLCHPENGQYTEEDLVGLKPGIRIVVEGELTPAYVFAYDGIYSFAYTNNFQHATYTTLENISILGGQMGFWDSVREYIRELYCKYMDARYAGLAFSVLVGDKTALPSDIALNFQISGIAHVVAVSGLNTAFIMMLLMFILNKCRINRWVKLSIVVGILWFYAMLCGMAPSVVRASLMSIFLLIGQLFGKQTDSLNSISLSGILLLLIFPLYIFDLSFLLSYAGVFGIFLLYPVFKKWLKVKKGSFIRDNLALTLSATLGTLPLIINAFGYVSIVGLLANLILVPLFGYAFMVLFGATLLALLIPFAGYLFSIIQYGFWVVDKGAMLFASVPYAIVEVKPIADYALAGYYGCMFFSSRFCVANPYAKALLIEITATVFIVGTILSMLC